MYRWNFICRKKVLVIIFVASLALLQVALVTLFSSSTSQHESDANVQSWNLQTKYKLQRVPRNDVIDLSKPLDRPMHGNILEENLNDKFEKFEQVLPQDDDDQREGLDSESDGYVAEENNRNKAKRNHNVYDGGVNQEYEDLEIKFEPDTHKTTPVSLANLAVKPNFDPHIVDKYKKFKTKQLDNTARSGTKGSGHGIFVDHIREPGAVGILQDNKQSPKKLSIGTNIRVKKDRLRSDKKNKEAVGNGESMVVYRQWENPSKDGKDNVLPQKHRTYKASTEPSLGAAAMTWDKIPVQRVETASIGKPWPEPACDSKQHYFRSRMRFNPDDFHLNILGETCEVLNEAVERYTRLIKTQYPSQKSAVSSSRRRWEGALVELNVTLLGTECGEYPSLHMDESYSLVLSVSNGSYLRANEVWGLLRGLETFVQLIHRQPNRNSPSNSRWYVHELDCSDSPRFKHRGILIDTGRHYLSTSTILTNLDAMSMNKMNVLHWHIVDDQSFPYQSKAFPMLSEKGAYGKQFIYTSKDISKIVEYARLRGIRVIPEFDSPGHTESWEKGQPGLLSQCPGGHLGPINPISEDTYSFMQVLFNEVAELFPDKFIHLGGDESGYYCWAVDANITRQMEDAGMKRNFAQLFGYYIRRLQDILTDARPGGVSSIVWQEVFQKGVKLAPGSIVQVWKDDYGVIYNLTKQKQPYIFSSCWYLNYIKYGADWKDFYSCEPTTGTGENSDMVLGGEACMWGEYIDDSNLISTLWPRACAVAERLWSGKFSGSFYWAEKRYEEQRCRMTRRGIAVSPNTGPAGPCDVIT